MIMTKVYHGNCEVHVHDLYEDRNIYTHTEYYIICFLRKATAFSINRLIIPQDLRFNFKRNLYLILRTSSKKDACL